MMFQFGLLLLLFHVPTSTHAQLGSNSHIFKTARRITPDGVKEDGLKKLCAACKFGGASADMCKEVNDQCLKSLCITMCLQKTFEVEIKVTGGPKGLVEQVADPRTQLALGSQFKAYGCAKFVEACPFPDKKQDWLWNWVDERTYGGFFPSPILPAEACMHDPEDKETAKEICGQCKASVTVKPLECPFTNPPSNDDAMDPITSQMPMNPQAFANADDVIASEQVPAHKSYATRCEAVKKIVLAKKGAMEAAFKTKVCSCLGCCDEDPQCYFSSTFNAKELPDENK
jgi:hypothetical protein